MSELPPKDEYPLPPLQDDVADIILKRLPLSDYVRFGAVCRRWRSIQRRHALRYAPLPPPTIPLPWIFPSSIKHDQDSVLCYSPFERATYRFPLPTPLFPAAAELNRSSSVLASFSGWLLLMLSAVHTHCCWYLTLINPITPTHQIHLPALYPDPPFNVPIIGCVSSHPSHPSCSVIVAHRCEVFLLRLADANPHWIKLTISRPPPPAHLFIHKAVFCGNLFYCKCYKMGQMVAVDPSLPSPAVEMLDMGSGQLLPPRPYLKHQPQVPDFLVECNGRVLLVTAADNGRLIAVFEADLLRKRWSRVADVGGGSALLLGNVSCISLVADNVKCKEDCVYFPQCLIDCDCNSAEWKGFDLRGGRMIDGPWLPADSGDGAIVHQQMYGLLFLPALC